MKQRKLVGFEVAISVFNSTNTNGNRNENGKTNLKMKIKVENDDADDNNSRQVTFNVRLKRKQAPFYVFNICRL